MFEAIMEILETCSVMLEDERDWYEMCYELEEICPSFEFDDYYTLEVFFSDEQGQLVRIDVSPFVGHLFRV